MKFTNYIVEPQKFFEENKAFDWAAEFPQLCDNEGNFGGFDAIVGNPPYIFSRNKKFDDAQKKYYYKKYELTGIQLNTFSLFIERAIQLTNHVGVLSYIVPSNLLTISSFSKLRKYMIENMGNIFVINILKRVFEKANVDTCIIQFDKNINDTLILGELDSENKYSSETIHKSEIKAPDYIFRISSSKNKDIYPIIQNIENKSIALKDVASVSTGLKVYQTGKGKPAQTDEIKRNRIFHSKHATNQNDEKYLSGADVCRYRLKWSGEYLNYGEWIAEPRRSVPFAGKRILVRQIPAPMPYCIHATYTEEPYYNDINSMVVFKPIQYDLKYILAILNSKLISFWFQHTFDKLQRNIFPQFKVNELANFPIFKIDTSSIAYQQIIDWVDAIYFHQEIEINSQLIDTLIYKLYNITPDEIAIVENESSKTT